MHTLVFGRGRKQVTYISPQPIHMNFCLIESLKRNAAEEVLVELSEAHAHQGSAGPFLLSRQGIAKAASVMGAAFSAQDVDPDAYFGCVADYEACLQQITGTPDA